ncbi:hypothetical protein QBC42DRAFT_232168 [Cladorrhinum samala]|uniref:Uncharacterized protein n=1 Tax=Cladorrhinum samala TaxID=585594 RepID=A0AAV9HJI5_9PEZI|nr:hypothetical protein QBC42DRAFT_232168 [Cladorrhinum samala]
MFRVTIILLLPLLGFLLSPSLAAPTKWYEKYSVARVIVPQSYYEVLKMRISTPVNSKAVREVACLDRKAHIVSHDELAAELSICGGIEGSVAKCRGNLKETTGRRGTALFTLRAVDAAASPGAAINLTKARWEQCVRAARDQCPTGSLSGICVGGATTGDVEFSLVAVR